jgi:sporulation protein YlmC with PRC-barrel domain
MTPRHWWFNLFLVLAIVTPLTAQSEKGTSSEKKTPSTSSDSDTVTQTDEEAQSAVNQPPENADPKLLSGWIEAERQSDFLIEDVILDLETAQVALQIISWKHTPDAESKIAAIPYDPKFDRNQASKVLQELSRDEPRRIVRRLASTVHKAFGRDVYWSKYLTRNRSNRAQEFDKENFELASLTTLKNKKVLDLSDQVIGTLDDFAIDRKTGDILYAVVKSDDQLRAIPLGAFVQLDTKKDWKIELKKDFILQFEPIDKDNVPAEFDRGWQEYVAHRYGRNALQPEPKVDSEKVDSEKVDSEKVDSEKVDSEDAKSQE